MREKKIIGRKDIADFPDLNLKNINIKVDTGAYTSAIHCRQIEVEQVEGKNILHYTLLDPTHKQYDNKTFSTESFKEKRVKNSFGGSEKRFVIVTTIRIFKKRYKIELSLSERGEMRFPVLIGRKFLMGKFIVNPSEYDISHKQKLKAKIKRKKIRVDSEV